MSELSARLSLPYLQPSQAQKHVTHNEALEKIDALLQLVVEAVDAGEPPVAPALGEVWALGASTTGAWAGHAGELAQWMGEGWAFILPQQGWRAWDRAAAAVKVFDGEAWRDAVQTQNLDGIGVGASWDNVNRVSVSSEASLFSHSGAGHQMKLNKAAPSDVGSVVFQTNWVGHAEFGLVGDNDFRVRTSVDGTNWRDALVIDVSDGTLGGDAVQIAPDDVGAGKLARADFVYGPGNLLGLVSQSDGTPTGAVMETGANGNGHYVRLADGTQFCFHTRRLFVSGASNWSFPAVFSEPPKIFGARETPDAIAASLCVETAATSTSVSISFRGSSDQRVGGDGYLMAIGRWF